MTDERNYFAQVQLHEPMTLLEFNTGIWMRGFFLEYECFKTVKQIEHHTFSSPHGQ